MKKWMLLMPGILMASFYGSKGEASILPGSDQLIQTAINFPAIINIFRLTPQIRTILLVIGVLTLILILITVFLILNEQDSTLSSLKREFRNKEDEYKDFQKKIRDRIHPIEISSKTIQTNNKSIKDLEERLKVLEAQVNSLRSEILYIQTSTPQAINNQEPWQSSVSKVPRIPDNRSSSYIDQLVDLYNQNIRELIRKGISVNLSKRSAKKVSTSLGIEIIDFEQSRGGTFVVIADDNSDQHYLFPLSSMQQVLGLESNIIQACYETPNHLRENPEGAQMHQPALVQQLESGNWRLIKRGKIGSSDEPA